MSSNQVAFRYAKALFEVAKEKNIIDVVSAELAAIINALTADESIEAFFLSPVVPPTEKTKLLRSLGAKLHPDVFSFLNLLASRNRLDQLSELMGAFLELSDEDRGFKRGTVLSAAELNQTEKSKLESSIEAVINKKVILTFKQDSDLIGGAVAKVGGWTFDDSLKSHLRRMNEELNRRVN